MSTKKKVVRLSFIDDGDDMTDDAVLAGLKWAQKKTKSLEQLKKLPSVTKRISKSVKIKVSDMKKSD